MFVWFCGFFLAYYPVCLSLGSFRIRSLQKVVVPPIVIVVVPSVIQINDKSTVFHAVSKVAPL